MLVRSPSVTRLPGEERAEEERSRRDRVGREETPPRYERRGREVSSGREMKREREARKERVKKGQSRSGVTREGDEGNERRRLWASRVRSGEGGMVPTESRRESGTSGVAGWEAEKGCLIASECKRFGVRWDTGRQSGGRAG